MFSWRHALIPIAVIWSRQARFRATVHCKELYVFGIRLAYWTARAQ